MGCILSLQLQFTVYTLDWKHKAAAHRPGVRHWCRGQQRPNETRGQSGAQPWVLMHGTASEPTTQRETWSVPVWRESAAQNQYRAKTKVNLLKSSVMDGPSFPQRVSVYVATATATEPLQEQFRFKNDGEDLRPLIFWAIMAESCRSFMHDGCKIRYMKGSPCHLAGRWVILELKVLRPSLPWFIYYQRLGSLNFFTHLDLFLR